MVACVMCSKEYGYYIYPFCSPPKDRSSDRQEDYGHSNKGSHLPLTSYKLPFTVDVEFETLCNGNLSDTDIQLFRKAILRDYQFEVWQRDVEYTGISITVNRHQFCKELCGASRVLFGQDYLTRALLHNSLIISRFDSQDINS